MSEKRNSPVIIPVFIPFQGCRHSCIYCEQRHITNTYSFENMEEQIKTILANTRPHSKKQLAFYGGTFCSLSQTMQQHYLDLAHTFMNQDSTIESVRISTSPDSINEQQCEFLHNNRVKTIEIGVQSTSGKILEKNGRKYGKDECENAFFLLKKWGFESGAQIMTGMYGATRQDEMETLNDILHWHPDFLRIYPTVVMPGTRLEELYKNKLYTPQSLATAIVLCEHMYDLCINGNIRVIRMGLHASEDLSEKIIAGPYHHSFGSLVKSYHMYKKILHLILDIFTEIPHNKGYITIRCNRKQEPEIRGYKNYFFNRITAACKGYTITVIADSPVIVVEFRRKADGNIESRREIKS